MDEIPNTYDSYIKLSTEKLKEMHAEILTKLEKCLDDDECSDDDIVIWRWRLDTIDDIIIFRTGTGLFSEGEFE